MIKVEILEQFKKTYSDENFLIRKIGTNEIYSEAYDLLSSNYEYEETDELFEQPEEKTEQ